MFDLERAISGWRRQLESRGIKVRGILDELESHLREDVEMRMRKGEATESAFELAVARVGEVEALKAEFAKATKTRGGWEKVRIAVCVILMGFIIFLSGAAIILCYSGLTDRILAVVALTCTLGTACCWSRAVPALPVISGSRVRTVAAVGCILTGIGVSTFYCQVILPHFTSPYQQQLPAAGFWILLPVAMGFGLGCGLDEAARRRPAKVA